jgi:hypothetical protein
VNSSKKGQYEEILKRTILSKWSETPSHHILICLRKASFSLDGSSSASGASSMFAKGEAALSTPLMICKRGGHSSKTSSIGDNKKEISAEAEWRTILNLKEGKDAQGGGGGVVCSQRGGVDAHIKGE